MRKNERQGFENLRRIIKVERRGSRGDKTYEETAYYISSLTESAQVFAKIIRGHWKIENQLHWVKDVIFEEDKSQISDFQAASNWSILTTIGLNLFRGLGFLSITEGQRWLAERWEKLTNSPLLEAYGLSETSPAATINPINGTHRRGSIGLPLPNTEIKLFDEGRHEMLNEINKQEVYQYIYNWIDKKVFNGK